MTDQPPKNETKKHQEGTFNQIAFLNDVLIAFAIGTFAFYLYSFYITSPDVFPVRLHVERKLAPVYQWIGEQSHIATEMLAVEIMESGGGFESFVYEPIGGNILTGSISGGEVILLRGDNERLTATNTNIQFSNGVTGIKVITVEDSPENETIATERILMCSVSEGLVEVRVKIDKQKGGLIDFESSPLLQVVDGQPIRFCNSIAYLYDYRATDASERLKSLVIFFTDAFSGDGDLYEEFVHWRPGGRLIQFNYGEMLDDISGDVVKFTNRTAEAHAKTVMRELQFANGVEVVWAHDGDAQLLLAETFARRLWQLKYNYNHKEITNKAIFLEGSLFFDNIKRLPYVQPLNLNASVEPFEKQATIYVGVPCVLRWWQTYLLNSVTSRWLLSILPVDLQRYLVTWMSAQSGHGLVLETDGTELQIKSLYKFRNTSSVSEVFPITLRDSTKFLIGTFSREQTIKIA